jgi:glycosyltransferase involved in cell wall biosynthesis
MEVSVIIPTYNRPDYLSSAIASVYAQSFKHFEIVVVDDASTEDARSIVNRYNDGRIKYIVHEYREGEAGARNTGLANSHGQYIAFLDDDDEWLPQKLQLQHELLSKCPPNVGAVYAAVLCVSGDTGHILRQIIPEKKGYIYDDMVGNVVGMPSSMFLRRACFDRVGLFDKSIVYGTDYDMWIRISKHFCFEHIRDPLVKYRVHPNRMTNNVGLRIRGLEALMEKHRELFSTNKQIFSQHYLEYAHLCRKNGDLKKAWRASWEAVRLCPYEAKRSYPALLKLLILCMIGRSNFDRLRKLKSTWILKDSSEC